MTSNELDKLIETTYSKVQSRSDHWLLPTQRQALYRVIDPPLSMVMPLRFQTRPWLELFTARYVLSLWEPIRHDPEQIWNDYYEVPAAMIALLNELLRGNVKAELLIELAKHWAEVNALTGELPWSKYYHAWCVYEAALKALGYSLGWDAFSRVRHFARTTTQIENDSGDCANFAAIAFSGGIWRPRKPKKRETERVSGMWDRELEVVRVKRLRFWEWWLFTAIPAARKEARSQT